MLFLGIDTSAVAASAALCEVGEDFKIIASTQLNTAKTHSQTIMPMIEAMLKTAGIALQELDAIAVSVGPGSFTGLRISVSAVKGMAMALSKPVIPVSTLEALAYNLSGIDCVVATVMDARCNQVYNANFEISGETITRITADRALTIAELVPEIEALGKRVILVGDGAELVKKQCGNDSVTLAPVRLRLQSGVGVCMAAANKTPINAKELMPSYLRLPQAERERLARIEKESRETAERI